jgi:hypothetical protein
MSIEPTELEALSHKAVRVLGADTIFKMSRPQQNLLDRALGRILQRRLTAEAVTPDEIIGQYEQIVFYVLPNGAYEHLLPPD